MPTDAVVEKIMTTKVVTISPDEFVYRAAKLMAENGVRSCVAVRDEKPIDIVTGRDMVRRVVARGLSAKRTRVQDIISSLVIGERTSTDEAAAVMAKHRIRRLVVMRDEKLAGIVNVTDLVKMLGTSKFEQLIPALLRG